MNTDKFPFKKVFSHTGTDFSAVGAAEKWLKEKGFSLGTMCSPEPSAIVHGNTYVPKWKHLSHEDQAELDGVAIATNWRTGDVTVHLKFDPDKQP